MHTSYEMPVPEPGLGFPDPAEASLSFSIRFVFNGIIYHAQVLQKETTVMEYHVTAVHPVLAYLPDPFIVASNLRRDLFDFPVNETYYPVSFGKAIVAAIETVCAAKSIPVFSLPPKENVNS
ncbi:MAG: hypothetical protein JO301_13190 [Chitinophagaceae bacterium]|nr:hypothetical protein [Chitinophagaceae bacterium]